MPVILDQADLDLWLGPEPWGDAHRALLKPCPNDWLAPYPVSNDAGAVRNEYTDPIVPDGDPIF